MNDEILRSHSQLKDQKGLANLIRQLRSDLLENPDNWQNTTLPSYLYAVSSWTQDDGPDSQFPDLKYLNWKLLGNIFWKAIRSDHNATKQHVAEYDLSKNVSDIHTQTDFSEFIGALSKHREDANLSTNKADNLDEYLEEICKVIEETEFKTEGERIWKAYGDIFIAASMYE